MLKIGIVAGEPSGDLLGADLVRLLKTVQPDLEIAGIGGTALIAEGCRSLYPMERLSVMGLAEVARRFIELLGIRRALKTYFTDNPPDIFIGVDAPDFNLPLERYLREHGIRTVHYVSPSVWAWRRGRIKGIARSVDLMLTLFPFEMRYYRDHNIPAICTGHPLARKIPENNDPYIARQTLHLPEQETTVAILPGSRQGEIKRLAPVFLDACRLLRRQCPDIRIVAGLLDEDAREQFEDIRRDVAADLDVQSFIHQTHTVIAAADVVLVASGTAALEVMLVKRPMVVGYRVNWLTGVILKHMVRLPFVSLPNLLAGTGIVPEHLQDDCTPERLAESLSHWLNDDPARREVTEQFRKLHRQLRHPVQTDLASRILALANDEHTD